MKTHDEIMKIFKNLGQEIIDRDVIIEKQEVTILEKDAKIEELEKKIKMLSAVKEQLDIFLSGES